MKNKIISAIGIAIIASCLIGCASSEPAKQKDNQYKDRAKEIVKKTAYDEVYSGYDILNAQ